MQIIASPTNSENVVPRLAWLLVGNVFVSDGQWAWGDLDLSIIRVWGWDFTSIPDEAIILEVWIGVDMYQSIATESVEIRVSVDNQASWSAWSDKLTNLWPQDIIWSSATSLYPWNKNLLDAANLSVQIRHRTDAGSGCPDKFPWSTHLDWVPIKVIYSLGKPMSRFPLEVIRPPTIDLLYVQRMHYLAWKATKHLV